MNLTAWGKAWANGTWSKYSWESKAATMPIGGGGKPIKEDYYFDFPVFGDEQAKRKKRKRDEILLMMQ